MVIARLALAAVLVLLVVPTAGRGQISTSVAGGLAYPIGEVAEGVDQGFTIRGQAGVSLLLVSVHAQAGYTHLPGEEIENLEMDDVDFFHAGVGARLGLGLVWAGLNAAWFTGDADDGLGILPELGAGFGPIEVVADGRLDGDAKWVAVRAGFRF